MVIRDLSYLENLSEEPKIVGSYGFPVAVNLINARQLALSKATSFGFNSDSLAEAGSLNIFIPIQMSW